MSLGDCVIRFTPSTSCDCSPQPGPFRSSSVAVPAMSTSAALQVALGLIFIYLVLSIICTGLGQATSTVRGVRGRLFREYVESFVGDPELAYRLYEHPFVSSFAEPSRRNGPFAESPYRQRSLAERARRRLRRDRLPSEIPGGLFAVALFDAVGFGNGPRPGDRGVTQAEGRYDWDPALKSNKDPEFEAAIDRMPPHLAFSVRSLLRRAQGDVNVTYASVAELFHYGTLLVRDRARRQGRLYLWLWAVAVTVALNVDTAHIADVLWSQAITESSTTPLPLGWSASDIPDTPGEVVTKAIGWFLTAGAVTFGSDFWLGLLERLARVRPSRDREDDERDERRRS